MNISFFCQVIMFFAEIVFMLRFFTVRSPANFVGTCSLDSILVSSAPGYDSNGSEVCMEVTKRSHFVWVLRVKGSVNLSSPSTSTQPAHSILGVHCYPCYRYQVQRVVPANLKFVRL